MEQFFKKGKNMSTQNVTIIQHPLMQHMLGELRNKETDSFTFRRLVNEAGRFLAYEATKDYQLSQKQIETPMTKATVPYIEETPVVVSIMRAGNGMLDGILSMLPFASAGHIGIYRDKFINNTVEYYFKLPVDVQGREILLADPMLASGDTAVACVDRLKKYNVGKIKLLSILTSQPGIDKLHHFHPDVDIYCIGKDSELNDKAYIIPGLGDAGDRLYQTK